MKLSLATLTLLLAACASHPSAPVQAPTEKQVEVVPPKPTDKVVDRSKWSITLPGTWIVRPGPSPVKGRVTQDLVARSVENVGAGPIVVAVMVVDLNEADDPKDEEFGAAAIMSTMRQGVNVIKATPTLVDGKPGSLAMFHAPSGMLIIQEAVGHNRSGIVARCGGDIDQGGKIIEACQPILESLHLKK